MWKNILDRGMPQMTIWRMCIECRIPKATNTLRLCNTHCSSTATVVAGTRLGVTLFVLCLSRFIIKPTSEHYVYNRIIFTSLLVWCYSTEICQRIYKKLYCYLCCVHCVGLIIIKKIKSRNLFIRCPVCSVTKENSNSPPHFSVHRRFQCGHTSPVARKCDLRAHDLKHVLGYLSHTVLYRGI